jgi:hypothetical protein
VERESCFKSFTASQINKRAYPWNTSNCITSNIEHGLHISRWGTHQPSFILDSHPSAHWP